MLAAVPAEGGSAYAEIILTIRDCKREPCTLMIGADRSMPEGEFRSAVLEAFRRHRDGSLTPPR